MTTSATRASRVEAALKSPLAVSGGRVLDAKRRKVDTV